MASCGGGLRRRAPGRVTGAPGSGDVARRHRRRRRRLAGRHARRRQLAAARPRPPGRRVGRAAADGRRRHRASSTQAHGDHPQPRRRPGRRRARHPPRGRQHRRPAPRREGRAPGARARGPDGRSCASGRCCQLVPAGLADVAHLGSTWRAPRPQRDRPRRRRPRRRCPPRLDDVDHDRAGAGHRPRASRPRRLARRRPTRPTTHHHDHRRPRPRARRRRPPPPAESTTTTTEAAPGQECGPNQTRPGERGPRRDQVICPEKDEDGTRRRSATSSAPSALERRATSAAPGHDPDNGSWVVELDAQATTGSAAMNEMRGRLLQRRPDRARQRPQFAIVLDGVVESAPSFRLATFDRASTIIDHPGTASREREAKDLALVLRYGALPVELEPQTVQTVSATLGKDSLHAGLVAGLVGHRPRRPLHVPVLPGPRARGDPRPRRVVGPQLLDHHATSATARAWRSAWPVSPASSCRSASPSTPTSCTSSG